MTYVWLYVAMQDPDGDGQPETPSVVIYIVDPFSYSHSASVPGPAAAQIDGDSGPDVTRLAMLGLLRCYQEMVRDLPEELRQHVHLQVNCGYMVASWTFCFRL